MKATQSLALMFALGTTVLGGGGLAVAGEPATAAKPDMILFPLPILHFSKIITGPRSVAFDAFGNTFIAFNNRAIWGIGPTLPEPEMAVGGAFADLQAIHVCAGVYDNTSHLLVASADGEIMEYPYGPTDWPHAGNGMATISPAYGTIQSIAGWVDHLHRQHVAVLTRASGGSLVWDVVQGAATIIANTVDSIDGPAVDIAGEDMLLYGENMIQVVFASHIRQFTWPQDSNASFNSVTETLRSDADPWVTTYPDGGGIPPIISFSANARSVPFATPLAATFLAANRLWSYDVSPVANQSGESLHEYYSVTPTSIFGDAQGYLTGGSSFKHVIALSDGEVWQGVSNDGFIWTDTLLDTFQTP
jgi:hypothetical protein